MRDRRLNLIVRASSTQGAPEPPAGPTGPVGPEQERSVGVLEREETSDDDGDADRFAHYVRKDRMARSQASGRPVVALCGKVWTPRRDPSKYPVCPECKEIYKKLKGGDL
ncbi:MAG TPA: DUF3039 domain-containing protein [Actinomycetaceae bacterium]|nr:DUF3039 domain-containing protein [Actinomycetaceae bacterium]